MNKEEELKKFIELEEELYKNMIEGIKIILKFVREAAESQNQEVIERGWSLCNSLRVKSGILNDANSSKEEVMSLATKIFKKLPIEISLITIAIVRDEDEKLVPRNKRGIYCNDPNQS